ncbi:hypothetical protein BaRGS_00021168, partial [Batillaria attramentaria]
KDGWVFGCGLTDSVSGSLLKRLSCAKDGYEIWGITRLNGRDAASHCPDWLRTTRRELISITDACPWERQDLTEAEQ